MKENHTPKIEPSKVKVTQPFLLHLLLHLLSHSHRWGFLLGKLAEEGRDCRLPGFFLTTEENSKDPAGLPEETGLTGLN